MSKATRKCLLPIVTILCILMTCSLPVYAATKLSKPKIVSVVQTDEKEVSINWKEVPGAKGYNVQYRIKGGKWKTKTTKKTLLIVTKLKANKKYQFRVRAYKTVKGKKQYGKYSAKKTIKVTKNSENSFQANFLPTGLYIVPNGTYNILSALNNSKCIDIRDAKKTNGTRAQLWEYADVLQQQFTFTRVSGAWYKIIDVNSNKALDVTGGQARSGVPVQIYNYNGTNAQLWRLIYAGNYVYIQNKLGYCLDVSGASTRNGTNIQVYNYNGTNAQKFKLNKTEPYSVFGDKTVIIQSALNNNKVVDVSGAGTSNGANIQIWDFNSTNAQVFTLKHVGTGYYKISNVLSGKVLDVAGGASKSGVNVQLYEWNGSNAQLWRFYPAGNGYYYIKNKLGYYLDVKEASTTAGTNIWVFSFNKSTAQKWSLRQTSIFKNPTTSTYNRNGIANTAKTTASSSTELCAGFVSDCLIANGVKMTKQRGVGNLYSELLNAGFKAYDINRNGQNIYKSGGNNAKINVGDVIIFKCLGCSSAQKPWKHTGIVTKIDANNKVYITHRNPGYKIDDEYAGTFNGGCVHGSSNMGFILLKYEG